MGDLKTDLSTAFEHAADELRHNRKKAVVLGVLALVACVLAIRLLFRQSSPADAGAAAPPAAAPADGRLSAEPPAPEDYQAGGDEEADGQDRPIRRAILRDLFAPNTDFFPPIRKKSRPRGAIASAQTRPVTSQEELRRQIILGQANGLALQCTMISSSPTAVINGRVLQIGGRINGFEVVDVTPHGCTVRKDGVSVVLKMGEQGRK